MCLRWLCTSNSNQSKTDTSNIPVRNYGIIKFRGYQSRLFSCT